MPAVLTLLRIKNLALVEELEWQMAPGFIAVTGETGAGKSIIIGALQLLLGERADKSLIRTGADLCTVEAVFAGGDLKKLNPQLVEAGIDPSENRTAQLVEVNGLIRIVVDHHMVRRIAGFNQAEFLGLRIIHGELAARIFERKHLG